MTEIDWGLADTGPQARLRSVYQELWQLWRTDQIARCWRNIPLVDELLEKCGQPFQKEWMALGRLTGYRHTSPGMCCVEYTPRCPRRTGAINTERLFWFPPHFCLGDGPGFFWVGPTPWAGGILQPGQFDPLAWFD